MKSRINDTDYLYMSMRLRSLENSMFGKKELEKLIDSRTFDEAYKTVCDAYGGDPSFAGEDYEYLLKTELEKTYALCEKLISDSSDDAPKFLCPIRLAYDCHNLKSAIKCESLGKDPRSLFLSCGNVPENDVSEALEKRDFSAFSKNLGKAASNAIETLNKTHDPQSVDLILDKAAFEDMAEHAKLLSLPYLSRLVSLKADITNVCVFARSVFQGRSAESFSKLILSGGTLPDSFFDECYDGSLEKLMEKLKFTRLSRISEEYTDVTSVKTLEKICDNIYMDEARSAKYVPFGPETVIGYTIGKETEIKNVRIVLSGKKARLAGGTIRASLRESY